MCVETREARLVALQLHATDRSFVRAVQLSIAHTNSMSRRLRHAGGGSASCSLALSSPSRSLSQSHIVSLSTYTRTRCRYIAAVRTEGGWWFVRRRSALRTTLNIICACLWLRHSSVCPAWEGLSGICASSVSVSLSLNPTPSQGSPTTARADAEGEGLSGRGRTADVWKRRACGSPSLARGLMAAGLAPRLTTHPHDTPSHPRPFAHPRHPRHGRSCGRGYRRRRRRRAAGRPADLRVGARPLRPGVPERPPHSQHRRLRRVGRPGAQEDVPGALRALQQGVREGSGVEARRDE
eukprot:363362-Chlamydomonas_euryale.AAC.12